MTGRVIWITGLSGAGKTTVSRLVRDKLAERGGPAVLLDGDILREIFGNDLGHHREDRLKSANRNARLCKALADQGVTVVIATISLFHEIHDWNRGNIENYIEVYIKVPLEELKARDPQGLYARAEKGEQQNVYGIDLQAEEPQEPDLVIENFGGTDAQTAAEKIVARVF